MNLRAILTFHVLGWVLMIIASVIFMIYPSPAVYPFTIGLAAFLISQMRRE